MKSLKYNPSWVSWTTCTKRLWTWVANISRRSIELHWILDYKYILLLLLLLIWFCSISIFPLICIVIFFSDSNIPESDRLSIFDSRTTAVVTHLMNEMNNESMENQELNEHHKHAEAKGLTDPTKHSLKLTLARKELCYFAHRCIFTKDRMSAELLCLIRLYIIKPCKGYVTTSVPKSLEGIEKRYGCRLAVHSELDEARMIVHIEAACVSDYNVIKKALTEETWWLADIKPSLETGYDNSHTVHDPPSTTSNEETFLQDFPNILKRTLQNY